MTTLKSKAGLKRIFPLLVATIGLTVTATAYARPNPEGSPLPGPIPGPINAEEDGAVAAPPEVETPPFLRQPIPKPLDPILPFPVNGPISLCPNPMNIVLQAPPPSQATPYMPDFPVPPGPQWLELNFNGTTPNRHFRHTFRLPVRPNQCCQVTQAKLELEVVALLRGQSNQSPNAGNDTISIWKNGQLLHWQYIWNNFPVNPGTTQTVTIPIAASWLNGYRLSFRVQDDTAVLNAKLVVNGCCVSPNIRP